MPAPVRALRDNVLIGFKIVDESRFFSSHSVYARARTNFSSAARSRCCPSNLRATRGTLDFDSDKNLIMHARRVSIESGGLINRGTDYSAYDLPSYFNRAETLRRIFCFLPFFSFFLRPISCFLFPDIQHAANANNYFTTVVRFIRKTRPGVV